MAQIIILNGTSSSGKSTLARAIQERASQLFLYFSIDSVLYALPQNVLKKLMSGEPAPEVRYRDLVSGYYGCVRALAAAGNAVVTDNAVTTRWQAEMLVAAVEGHDVTIVGIDCSIETLEAREETRGDRRPGLARSQYENVHKWLDYDVRVNSDTTAAADAADIVLNAAASSRSAISSVRQRLI